MRSKPQEKCKWCEHWTKWSCTKNMHGYPLIGPACERFYRTTGSDDDKEWGKT
jgi:hypothetical protein